MKPVLCLLTVALLRATPVSAQPGPIPAMSAEQVASMLDGGNRLEKRIDGDLNGDGDIDTVFVGRGEDQRSLMVWLAYRGEVDFGHQPVGTLQLDPYPLGDADLSIRKGVLLIEDLTGGTTATQSTYRYRYDPKAERMRLIGLDAQRYSRTNSHGTVKLSWNLLTGERIVERGEVNDSGQGDQAIDYAPPKRDKKPSKPLYMETTPNPDALLESL